MLKPPTRPIRVAIVGVGNCASSLVQGLQHYRQGANDLIGAAALPRSAAIARPTFDVVAAFDVDARKVGRDVAEAIFATPNCTTVFCADVPPTGRDRARWGRCSTASPSTCWTIRRRARLRARRRGRAGPCRRRRGAARSGRRGAGQLSAGRLRAGDRFYAECALEAGVRVGQLHAGLHRQRSRRGRSASRDARPADRRRRHQGAARRDHRPPRADRPVRASAASSSTAPTSSTPAATPTSSTCSNRDAAGIEEDLEDRGGAVAARRAGSPTTNIHIGPSDYVPWQNDNKVCFLRMEGRLFGGVPMNLELRLSVEDSPNSRRRRDRRDPLLQARASTAASAAPIDAASAFFCKHPPRADDRRPRI